MDTALNFFVPAGEEIRVYLQWNDPFGGSSNNYDMLLDDGNLILDSSEAPQDGSDDPLEMVSWINDTGVDTQVFVSILKFAGIAKTLELFAFGGGVIAVDDDATTGDSIFGHKAVEEAISVAAIDSFDAGLDTIETFSSRGPSTIDFPSFEIRQTPFITAVDGVSVTGAGGFPNTFFGTSAAAPHVAAICALMLEKNPSLSPAEIMAHLAAFSDDRGANGFDSTFGYGLIDALAAVQSVPLLSSTVTLNPTRDATIFSENGSEANGSGNLFVGRILPGDFRRALLFFDIVNGDGQNSGVPAGATIDSVTLTLDVSKSAGGTASTSLEKLTRDWNEGPAGNVGSGGGQGDAAGPSDVTWTQTGNGENWTTPGGDRSGSVSATHTIISNSPEWSSTQMAMDVQDWLDSPSMNFGWILIGNEQAGSRNARRFGSKETGTAPQLLIDFTPGALPTTFTVNTNDDIDDGVCDATHCSLREAIKIANANLPDSTITFDSGLAGGTITLNGTQLPEILSDLTITGLGTNLLTVDGGNQSRIFQIGTGVNVELSNLSLLGGAAFEVFPDNRAGAILNFGNLTIDNCTIEGNASAFGGGVFNDNGTLTIIESTIADNDGDSSGGAIYNFLGAVDVFDTVFSSNNVGSGSGGGIFNDSGTLSITDSTFSGNTTGNRGGGLFNGGGTVEVFGSTFLANTAIGFGGAIYNLDPGSVRVVNSTISDNESLDHGGGIRNLGGSLFVTNCTVTGNRSDMDDGGSGDGGGIATDVDTVCLYNTIVARNFRGTGGTLNDIDGQVDESGSFFNLVGDSATAGGLLDGINDNIIGADPILGSLQDNGGLTLTHALLVGSPAIDAGSNAQALDADNFPLESDQRGEGFPRLIDGNRDGTITVDIGAFEVGGWTVTSSDDVDDGVCDATHCSLREALNAANSTTGTDTITFNIPGSGPHTIQPGTFLPTITDPVLVDGYSQPGASPNTNPPGIGSNAVLKIELDGTNAGGASGLLIGGADCTVQGLVINRFEFAGIHILGAGASGNFVQGNFIGTDVTGSAALGNGLSNVIIQDAPNNTVGGSQAGARNIISGSDQSGVFLLGPGASGNILQWELHRNRCHRHR